MIESDFRSEAQALIDKISHAESDSFLELLALIGIDSTQELSGQDLSYLDLTNADFSNANLSGTNFSNTNLRNVNLSGADLYKANFTNADLTETNIVNCRGLNLQELQTLQEQGAVVFLAIGNTEEIEGNSFEPETMNISPDSGEAQLQVALKPSKLGVLPNDELRQLACEACCHRFGSPERQRYLKQLIQKVKPHLWWEDSPYYQDALQQTWIYLCQNLCEGKTTKPYNPDIASIVTWLNAYLKFRLLDFKKASQVERQSHISIHTNDESITNAVETLPGKPEIPPILERVRDWLEQNANELRQIHIDNHPEVNCYEIIFRRLPPEKSWKAIETEFGVSYKTLESFYRRQCKPRLQEFGKAEGHLKT